MTEEARAEVANTEADLETTVLTQDLEVDLKSRKGQEGHHPTLMRAEMAKDRDQDSQETLSQLSKFILAIKTPRDLSSSPTKLSTRITKKTALNQNE